MRVYLGTLLNFPHDRQYLITVHDDGTVTSAGRQSSDSAEPWSQPVRLGEVGASW